MEGQSIFDFNSLLSHVLSTPSFDLTIKLLACCIDEKEKWQVVKKKEFILLLTMSPQSSSM